jgi:hypothetical protein
MIMSELENLDTACEMTVLPHPKAPGIAVVPPWTHLYNRQIDCLDMCEKKSIVMQIIDGLNRRYSREERI